MAQVVKNAKQSQARKARGSGTSGAAYADEAPAGDAPRRWSDYTVHFHFPEPTEAGSTSLLQARPHFNTGHKFCGVGTGEGHLEGFFDR